MKHFIKVLLTCAIVVLALSSSCTNDDGAQEALEGAGYTNVKLTGFSFGCAKDDATCTGFTATGPTGRPIRGAVGCGYLFKGCTIRTTR